MISCYVFKLQILVQNHIWSLSYGTKYIAYPDFFFNLSIEYQSERILLCSLCKLCWLAPSQDVTI